MQTNVDTLHIKATIFIEPLIYLYCYGLFYHLHIAYVSLSLYVILPLQKRGQTVRFILKVFEKFPLKKKTTEKNISSVESM